MNDEYIIQRVGPGIQLTPPNLAHHQQANLAAVMRLPMNFYFMDRSSTMVRMNDHTARTCGYISAKDGVGKSIRDVSDRDTIESILANDNEVITKQHTVISSESYSRFDGKELTALSIKFPWISDNNIRGVFGCSILLGDESTPDVSHALALLMQTGLLSPDKVPNLPLACIRHHYLDQRDRAILSLLIRGKTAKNIARHLGLSHRTIEHRLESIKAKFNVSSKAELIESIMEHILPDSTHAV